MEFGNRVFIRSRTSALYTPRPQRAPTRASQCPPGARRARGGRGRERSHPHSMQSCPAPWHHRPTTAANPDRLARGEPEMRNDAQRTMELCSFSGHWAATVHLSQLRTHRWTKLISLERMPFMSWSPAFNNPPCVPRNDATFVLSIPSMGAGASATCLENSPTRCRGADVAIPRKSDGGQYVHWRWSIAL